ILKRIVRAIADGSQSDLERLANTVVESERHVGHTKLADQLAAILARPRPKPAANENRSTLSDLPTSRRHGESLVRLIHREHLEPAANLRSVFQAAKERHCVLLLDECDFIARSRTNTKDIGEASRIVNSLLTLMEEYDAPGLLVATTNIEDSLDPALFRRFDEV